MLLLTTTSDVIRVVSGSAVTLDIHASWVDNASGTITPGRTNTEITTATTATVVPSPAASTQRNVQTMTVTNLSASASTVSIDFFDGTNTITLFRLSLLAGYTLQFAAGNGFTVFTSAGVILSAGATGATGATGPAGPQLVSVMQGDPGDDSNLLEFGVPTNGPNFGPTRTQLGVTAKNWQFLGQGITAVSAVRTNTVVWTGAYAQLMVEYYISGYAGNGIGRILCGNTAPNEAATDCCSGLIEGVTLTTTSVSVSGWPTAVNVANAQRYGVMFITNQATQVKRMVGNGQYAGTAPTVAPTMIQHAGMYNNTSTLIQQMSFVSYATITTNTLGTNFTGGTYFNVWGRNND